MNVAPPAPLPLVQLRPLLDMQLEQAVESGRRQAVRSLEADPVQRWPGVTPSLSERAWAKSADVCR